MLKNVMKWRREIGIDDLVNQELGASEKPLFIYGQDRQGRAVCYNSVYSEFTQDIFTNAQQMNDFNKDLSKIIVIEKTVTSLDFTSCETSSFLLVVDLRNSSTLGRNKGSATQLAKQSFQILVENYPECIFKYVCIDTSWWSRTIWRLSNRKVVTISSPTSTSCQTLSTTCHPTRFPQNLED